MIRSPILLGATSERERVTRIAAARMAVGATLLAPPVAIRLFGIARSHDTGSLRLVSRLFGIRNVALGVWALQVRDARESLRRQCYMVNAAVDAADIVVLLGAGLRHRQLRRAALMGTALGAEALLAWLELLGVS